MFGKPPAGSVGSDVPPRAVLLKVFGELVLTTTVCYPRGVILSRVKDPAPGKGFCQALRSSAG